MNEKIAASQWQFAGWFGDRAVVVLPALLWLLAVAIANPRGEFPLNDDWSFAFAVRHMLATGEFRPAGWTSMTLIGQVLWGSLFCLVSGFSFETLRLSTFVAGAMGLVAFPSLLRALGCSRRSTALATFVLGFNPLYFVLSFTFMTDVGFIALVLCSTLNFCRYLAERRMLHLWLAAVFSVAAFSVRQPALFLPIAMMMTLALERRRDMRAIAIALATAAVCVVMLLALHAMLVAHNAIPALYNAPYDRLAQQLASPGRMLLSMAVKLCATAAYLGWFLFPILIWRLPGVVSGYRNWLGNRSVPIAAGVAAVLVWVTMLALHWTMPLAGNVLEKAGIGPILIHDVHYQQTFSLPPSFWACVTLVAAAGAAMLVLDLLLTSVSLFKPRLSRLGAADRSVRLFLLFSAVVYTTPFLLSHFYDRYALPTALIVLILLTIDEGHNTDRAPQGMRFARLASCVTLAAMCMFSVAAAHDYMSFNRARWSLLDDLTSRGVGPERIDGGFEFNGLYLYDPNEVIVPFGFFWWVRDNEFIVATAPLPGYRIVNRAEFTRWLMPRQATMLVLERNAK